MHDLFSSIFNLFSNESDKVGIIKPYFNFGPAFMPINTNFHEVDKKGFEIEMAYFLQDAQEFFAAKERNMQAFLSKLVRLKNIENIEKYSTYSIRDLKKFCSPDLVEAVLIHNLRAERKKTSFYEKPLKKTVIAQAVSSTFG